MNAHQYLGNTVVGTAVFQICTLIGHVNSMNPRVELARSRRQACERRSETIDAIKFNRSWMVSRERTSWSDSAGQFPRPQVSSELYAKVVETFGQQACSN